MVKSCDTPQIERAEQQGIQTAPKRETILRLLDTFAVEQVPHLTSNVISAHAEADDN
jgi:hypothetical protein